MLGCHHARSGKPGPLFIGPVTTLLLGIVHYTPIDLPPKYTAPPRPLLCIPTIHTICSVSLPQTQTPTPNFPSKSFHCSLQSPYSSISKYLHLSYSPNVLSLFAIPRISCLLNTTIPLKLCCILLKPHRQEVMLFPVLLIGSYCSALWPRSLIL